MTNDFDIETVRSAVDSLHSSRADNHSDWVTVGMALKRLGNEGLGIWTNFSRQSEKFREGECERRWQSFNGSGGYSPATLFKWAKEDTGWRPSKHRSYEPAQVTEYATGNSTPVEPVTVADDENRNYFRGKARKLKKYFVPLLYKPGGKLGADFLLSRGLLPETWEAFRLGFYPKASLSDTEGKQKAPAIAIPWLDENRVPFAIRYRFLEFQYYVDKKGKDREEKITVIGGSRFKGQYFGLHLLQGRDILVIIEGEINGMSVWQVTGGAVDVLSVGSELSSITGDKMIEIVKRYPLVLVWFDKKSVTEKKSRELSSKVQKAIFRCFSPGEMDANDMLQKGILKGFLKLQFDRAISEIAPATVEPAADTPVEPVQPEEIVPATVVPESPVVPEPVVVQPEETVPEAAIKLRSLLDEIGQVETLPHPVGCKLESLRVRAGLFDVKLGMVADLGSTSDNKPNWRLIDVNSLRALSLACSYKFGV